MCGLSNVQVANVVVVSLYNTYCCIFFESIKQIFIEFHLPKIPGKNRIEWKVSRNSVGNFDQPLEIVFFFWKFGNSRNFLFDLASLSGMISALSSPSHEFCLDQSYNMVARTQHWMQNDLPQFEPVLD